MIKILNDINEVNLLISELDSYVYCKNIRMFEYKGKYKVIWRDVRIVENFFNR